MKSFTALVSLGYRCRSTQRLRAFFGVESAYPFDWWVSPLKGAARLLRDWDVEPLLDIDMLQEVHAGRHIAYVRHRRYGIKLQHDFPLDRKYIAPGWQEHIPAAKSRISHLMKKLDRLNRPGHRVLFCRELSDFEPAEPKLINELREAAAARTPLAEHEFLLISRSGMPAKGWISLRVDDPNPEPWSGDPAIWDRSLGSLGFRFESLQDEASASDPAERAGDTAPLG